MIIVDTKYIVGPYEGWTAQDRGSIVRIVTGPYLRVGRGISGSYSQYYEHYQRLIAGPYSRLTQGSI